ncbi:MULTISPECIES: FxSxx-COOH cyclophane-containing RiPP peptide [Actinoplanes]|uniref:FxSxx-COOH cyclophane-containing RiPP peptide n=1 Tax=Actinoplanes TaxID=1865 RepID=UPI0007C7A816|nr:MULTISPECIES: FxSxx-COOH cyclophane-containing RiPP peptide [Actinoplanes]
MTSRDTPVVGGSVLLDITDIPLERLAELESPSLSRLMDELVAQSEQPETSFGFSSSI